MPRAAHLLHNFTKFSWIWRAFCCVVLKLGEIRSRGFGVMGVWVWGSPVIPKFQYHLMAKQCFRSPNVCDVQEHARGPLSSCQVWWGSDFTRHCGSKKSWVFTAWYMLWDCLCVTYRSCIKMAKHRIVQTTLHDSPGTLFFWCQILLRNSTGVNPEFRGSLWSPVLE